MIWRLARTFLSRSLQVEKFAACSLHTTKFTQKFGWFKKASYYLLEDSDNVFSSSGISRSHLWDNLSPEKWKLVYRDVNGGKIFCFTAALIPIVVCGAVVLIADILWNDVHFSFTDRFLNDAEELGVLIAFPLLMAAVVFFLVFRIQGSRLLRIYQSNADPAIFTAVVPRMFILQKKMQFHRSAAKVTENDPGDYQSMLQFFRSAVVGTLSLNGKHFNHSDDCFISNSARSYMLNETDAVPLAGQVPKRRKRSAL